jgi:type IV secretion/conjugal transfer VirB4 family ATPase
VFSLREYRQPTHRLPDLLPWAALIDPGVVLQKDGLIQKTLAFRGPDLASSSPSELVAGVARLNNALRRFGSGWTLYVEAQRTIASGYPKSTWSNPAAYLVDAERRENYRGAGARFESHYYLTFVWAPPSQRAARAEALFYEDPGNKGRSDHPRRDLEAFKKTVAELADIMAGVFAEIRELDDDETLTYLHSTISTNRHLVRRPAIPMYLDGVLPDMAFTPGDIPMLGTHYIPTCTIGSFPPAAYPGILDDLNHLALEYRWVTRFVCMDKEEAQKELERYRKQWFQKQKSFLSLIKEGATDQESAFVDGSALSKSADADAALHALGDDSVSFGYFTATVTVWDQVLEHARRKMQVVTQAIQSRGFVVRDETLNSRDAWLGSLPGHVYANIRRPIVHTINLAHMMPVSAVWAGDQETAHLKSVSGVGDAHVTCSTSGDTPFRLNLAVQDVGHTLIIGPTGAGKSTLLALLAMQWLRYPGAKVVIFDKDRSARAATMAAGGTYYEPGDERSPVAFQPLANIDQRGERIWATQFVLNLLAAQRHPETTQLKARISEALASLASAPPPHRTLSVLAGMIGPELGAVLRAYTIDSEAGRFGQIFDADHDQLRDAAWLHFEMGPLMSLGEEAIVPALDYLFHRIEQGFDGSPTLLILDEAWLFLRHPIFMRRLQDWLKTLRKKNVYVVFATQEVADAADSPILPTILSACPTKIYLPNEEALTPHISASYAGFGLTETEIAILAQAQKKRDNYTRSVRGRRLFTLDLAPITLAFVAMSSPADQRFLDSLVASAPPEQYAELILRHRSLASAADRLAALRTQPMPYRVSGGHT